MNLRSRYGYLIISLKQYPFEKEIKELIEEIEVPWKPTDPNTGTLFGMAGRRGN